MTAGIDCGGLDLCRKMDWLFDLVGSPDFPELPPSWLQEHLGDRWLEYWERLNDLHESCK